MPKDAKSCQKMQKVANICEKSVKDAKRWQTCQKLATVEEVPKDGKSCQQMAKDTKNSQKYGKICQKKLQKVATGYKK